MEELCKNVPCREKEINQLFALIGERDQPLPCSIFISGNTATGKRICVKSILHCLDYKHAIINCNKKNSPQILYESILSGLKDNEEIECESMRSLVNELNKLAKELDNVYEPIVVVFEGAERLRNMEETMLPALLKLREYCQLNICTIFITQTAYEEFCFQMSAPEPIKLNFSNYNKEELYKIIFLEQMNFIEHILVNYEVGEDIKIEINKPELFAIFLKAFLSVFYRVCRNLRELKRMARVNFVAFCEPIILNHINATDLNKLWKHISSILISSLDMLYKCDKSLKVGTLTKKICVSNTDHIKKLAKICVKSSEPSYIAKYILISAFLASYNPIKDVKKVVIRHHGKDCITTLPPQVRVTEKMKKEFRYHNFTVKRLFYIFYAIQKKCIVDSRIKVLSLLKTLVEFKLIVAKKMPRHKTPIYKCNLSYAFISLLARNVNYNIGKHLNDFK